MSEPLKTLVIGLGNPILGDDGVGWHVARAVEAKWNSDNAVTPAAFETLSVGGLTLMEHMEGYDRVLLLDATATGERPVGCVSSAPLEALHEAPNSHTRSAHDTSLRLGLEVGHKMGVELPEIVWVVGVETDPGFVFTEELSPLVTAAIPAARDEALRLLREWDHDPRPRDNVKRR